MTDSAGAKTPVIIEGLFSFQLGGSERVGADVAKECVRRGYRVLCFAFYGSDGPMRGELEAAGVETVDLNYLRRRRFVRRFTYQAALYRFFKRQEVSAIHIHHATSLILGALPARWAGIKRIVMTEHSIREFQTMPRYRRQSRRYCRFADAITVIDRSMEAYFREELRVPKERLHFVPNGVRLLEVDAAQRMKLRQALGVNDAEFLWMYAGRLAPVKDLGTLVNAFAAASRKATQRWRLTIVGDGQDRAMLETLCQSLGQDTAISFLGARLDVPSLLTAADGFVMSSVSEGLPMVLLEAMAARVACVATAVGGIPELLSGGAGLIAPPRNVTALAEAMLDLSADCDRRHGIVRAAFAKVADAHDLERVVDHYLRLFGLPPQWPGSDNIGR
jgi:glycosyltransferase involved in cell wall biosynthesis